MSQTIDDRIVQLEFDNAQFEKGVQESLTTLEKLKQSLKLDDAGKSLSKLTDEAKKVDLSTISDSIDQLSEKFSTLRMVGLMALSNIVDGAFGMVKKIGSVLSAPIQQMKTGGWNRAMNLEQANFMMQGLLKNEEAVKAVMDDVSESVDGTAYSLDEAAKVAAQFSASGLKAGSTMLPALKAVAGTAAMTNSSFQDIGQIFTTVAGQGKLMTYQMRQLEFRGLNVAATLGEQLGKSEAEIRDMVTKGTISFEMFADAMNSAFGEHATEANNTFEGALSNMKSALNRIGAEFATPLLNNAIPVFNSLRLLINSIKGNMGELFKVFSILSESASVKLVTFIDRIRRFLESDFSGIKNLNNALYITIDSLIRIGKAIGTAFKTVFNGSAGDHINNMAEGIEHIAKVLAPTKGGLKVFTKVLTGIFTVIKKVGEAIGFIITRVGGPLFNIILKTIHFIFNLIAAIGKLISNIKTFIQNTGIIQKILDTINGIIDAAKDKFDEFRSALSDTSTVIGKVAAAITKGFRYITLAVGALIALPIYGIYTAFQKIRSLDFEKVVEAFTNLKNVIIDFFKYVVNLPIVQKFIDAVTAAFFILGGGIIFAVEKIKEFFTALANGEITFESIKQKILELPDAIQELWANIKASAASNPIIQKLEEFRQAIVDIFDKIQAYVTTSPVLNAIKNALSGLGQTFADWTNNLHDKLKGLTPAKLLLVAFAGMMTVLAFNANKLSESIIGFVDTANSAVGDLAGFLTKKKTKLEKFTTVVITLSIAVVALAGAFRIMADIPKEKLTQIAIILGSFVVGFAALNAVITKLDKEGKFVKNIKEISVSMALMGVALIAIAGALRILNDVEVGKNQWQKIGMLAAVLGLLAGFGIILAHFGPKTIAQALGLLAFAVTIQSVAKALVKLSGIDFSGIKGAWKEIAALILGLAALSGVLAALGTGVFLGVVAYLLIAKNLMKAVGEFSEEGVNVSEKVASFRESIMNMFAYLKGILAAAWEAFMQLTFWQKAGAIAIATAAMAAVLGAIYAIYRGILGLSEVAKGIRKLAVSFAIVAAVIMGILYFARTMAEWASGQGDATIKAFYTIVGVMAGFVLVVGAFMALSHLADPKSLGVVKKVIVAFGFAFLAIAGLMLIISTMTESQILQAEKIINEVITIIGIFAVLSELIAALSDTKSKFSHFIGLTILLGMIIGSFAALMIVLQDEDDYKRLAAALGTIVAVLIMLSVMFFNISKLKYNATWKTLLVMIGGAIAIGAAIVLLARALPDESYIGKVITVAAVILVMMTALGAIMLTIQHFAKDKRFSVTQTSTKTLKMSLAGLGELILGILVIAKALSLLKDANPGQLALTALTIVGVIAALVAIMLGLEYLTKKGKLKSLDKGILIQLFALVGIFAILAIVMAAASIMVTDSVHFLAVSQVIVLVILELAVIAAALSMLAGTNLLASFSMVPILALVGIFAILAIVMAAAALMVTDTVHFLAISQVIVLVILELAVIAAALGLLAGTALLGTFSMVPILALVGIFAILAIVMAAAALMVTDTVHFLAISQVIVLVILELAVIAAALGLLAGTALLGTFSMVPILALVGIFAILAVVMAAAALMVTDAGHFLKVSQVIVLVVRELSAIAAVLGLIAPLGLLAILSLPALLGLTIVFGVLALTLLAVKDIETDGINEKVEAITQVLWSMIEMLAALAALSLGSIGMVAGAASLFIIALAINQLMNALRSVQEIGPDQVAQGLELIAQGLTTLSEAGGTLAELGGGLIVLAIGIAAVGAACLSAAPGVTALSLALSMIPAIITAVAVALNLLAVSVASAILMLREALVGGLSDIKTDIKAEADGFIPDVIDGLIGGTKIAQAVQAAKEAGIKVASGFLNAFRDILGWHSTPDRIEEFEDDTGAGLISGSHAEGMFNSANLSGYLTGESWGEGLNGFDLQGTMQTFTEKGINGVVEELSGSTIEDLVKSKTGGILDGVLDMVHQGGSDITGEVNITAETIEKELGAANAKFKNDLDELDYKLQNGKISMAQYQIECENLAATYRATVLAVSDHKRALDNLDTKLKNGKIGLTQYEFELKKINDDYVKGREELAKYDDQLNEDTNTKNQNTTATTKAKSAQEDFNESLTKTLESQMDIFKKFEAKNPMNKSELLANMQSQIKGMTDWAGQMNKLATMGIDQGLYKKLAEMGPQGAEYVGAFANMTAEEMAQANAMWAQSLTLPGDIAGQVGASWASISGDMINGLSAGWTDTEGVFHKNVLDTSQAAQDNWKKMNGIESPSTVYKEFGFWMMLGLAQGITLNMHFPLNALEALCKLMIDKLKRELNPDNFKPIGLGVVQGIQSGIEQNMSVLETTMSKLATMVETAAKSKKGFDVNSPSKRMIPIGENISEGLVVGINRSSSSVVSSIHDLSDNAINAMKYTVANIAAMINTEIDDPVIRPVLDLSNVQAGARSLNSIFSTNQSIKSGSVLSNLQNGQYSGTGNVIFNQNNYSPKALSRIDIYRDTKNIMSQYKQSMA